MPGCGNAQGSQQAALRAGSIDAGRLADPDVIIFDVRTGSDWKASEFKIKGAVRVSSDSVDSWAAKYAKDKTLVLYCA